MARAIRMVLFAAISVLILLALAYAVFAYSTYLGTSPFNKTEMFPSNILVGIAILAPILLLTALTGCSGLYRLSIPHLHILVVALVFCTAAHIIVAHIASSEANYTRANIAASRLWIAGEPAFRATVEGDFSCCGWNAIAIANGTAAAAAAGRSHLCMQTTSCAELVVTWRAGIARIAARALYGAVGLMVATALVDLLLLRGLALKRRPARGCCSDEQRPWRRSLGELKETTAA
ncbi:hypothetical protein HDU89_006344 [Geranomyces variabilis]|nr:hypothetical protein HDU89_006344 [Geranomyces variabilis]